MQSDEREAQIDPNSLLGCVVGEKFRLDQCIGRTPDSLVFRACQINLQRDVAVKILLADPGGMWQLGARLRREAKIIAALRHPGLAEIYDEGVMENGLPYIVMEYLRGETLSGYLAGRDHLDPVEAVNIVCAAASVLEVVHAAGFVHRDIKPSNVFVERDARGHLGVKVIDFGAVRRLDRNDESAPDSGTLRGLGATPGASPPTLIRTMPGVVIGTPDYMSPEQCKAAELDARSDIYSLGIVLYELLIGVPPFHATTPTGVMAAHIAWPPPTFAHHDVQVPPALEAAVMRALEKNPEMRFSSMSELSNALVSAVAPSDVPPSVVPPSNGASEPPPDLPLTFSAYAVAALAFTLFAILGGIAVVRILGAGSPPSRAAASMTSAPPEVAVPEREPSAAPVVAISAAPSAPTVDVAPDEATPPASRGVRPAPNGASNPPEPGAKPNGLRSPPPPVRPDYRLEELKTPPVRR